MVNTEFKVFRVNFQDRADLFANPVKSAEDFLAVLSASSDSRCDVEQRFRKSGFRWSLRALEAGRVAGSNRSFASLTFARESLYKVGKVVTVGGMRTALSRSDPPLADGSIVFIDLDRHLLAVQDSFQVMKGRGMAWKNKLDLILSQGAWRAEFTSRVELEPIAPRLAIQAELQKLTRITRFRVTLRIPNPDLSETYRRLFEDMQRGGVRELTEDMRSERGLLFDTDTLPSASLEMALSGYRRGPVSIDGYQGEQRKRFKFGSEVATVNAPQIASYTEGDGDTSNPVRNEAAFALLREIESSLGRQIEREPDEEG